MESRTQPALLSADPQKQVLDYGFPLYRFQESSRGNTICSYLFFFLVFLDLESFYLTFLLL
jgi:hypothetical protein